MRLSRLFLLLLPVCAHAAVPVEEASCPQLDYSLPPLVNTGDTRVHVTADQGVLEQGGLSSLAGSVRLQQGDKEFSAQQMDYDDKERQVHVRQQSLFRNQNIIVRSQRLDFDLDSETGVFSDTDFTLPQRAARGDAGVLTVGRNGTAEFQAVRYTTCAPGSRGWYLEGRDIKLDQHAGVGTAHNVKLEFLGVPILYAPWFQFPIDNQRRTGLLFPTVGESTRTGFDFRWPLYLNLGPNYDATLTPRVMSKRGLLLGSNTRYLEPESEGHLHFDYLAHDAQTGEQRSYLQFDHKGLLASHLSLEAHYYDVSDQQYFEDLGGAVDATALTALDRSLLLTYQAPSAYTLTLLAQDYQVVDQTVALSDQPYRRLPQIDFRVRTKNSLLDTRAGLSSEYSNFLRADSVQGQRLTLQPYLLTEIEQQTWFLNSELNLDYTHYLLGATALGQPDSPTRTLPQFSIGSGLRFERFTAAGSLQTLEPQVFYLYTPFRDQDQLPVFDSGDPDFDFTQLFARNRFSGEDRISDANQLAVAATSRLLNPYSGEEKLAASIGQLYRFTQPQVQLPSPTQPPPSQGATDFIASLDYHLSHLWIAGFSSQWSPRDHRFNRASVAMHYRDSGRRFDVAYRYRQNILEQADIAGSAPLSSAWRGTARVRYSIADHTPLDTLAGVEYSTCCWALSTSYRRYISTTRGEFNSGVYLQLSLKGLSRIGTGYDNLDVLDSTTSTPAYR
ncbi:MAG TPA: LPS assembly protein LptD [Nevskiaceae bacterium]|nr:LPS assembly protein LptD [Nevskiaceae bacterium]